MKINSKKYKNLLEYYSDEYSFLVPHCRQVAKLAIQLFKQTKSLHSLKKKEKKYLLYASLLHDIGYEVESISHNKYSCQFIMNNPYLQWSKKTKKIVACIARYHRGSFPQQTHKLFGKLSPKKQNVVTILSSLLRIADGLDYTHQNSVKSLKVKIEKDTVTIEVIPAKDIVPKVDIDRAKKKSHLFASVFQLEEVIFCLKN
ncbi:MAG TPA: HD domain-containing protein [Candidatus Hydrogenedens sp.]|nr:HD domain-containing protein [Candidatus Hydrogenedens sp.]